MVGQDFLFGGKLLSDFGFIMAKPSEEDNSGLNRDILKGSTHAYRSQAIHYGTVYNDVITLPLFLIKFSCKYNDNTEISMFELRRLQAWLTSFKLPQPLYMLSREGTLIEYHGIFTEISPYVCNGLRGIQLKFTCDSPFGYSTIKTKIPASDAKNGTIQRLFCDTDETEEYIYPMVEFYPDSAGEISLKNDTDHGSTMRLSMPGKYRKVMIDCKLKRILADDMPLPLSDAGWNINHINDYNNVNTGIYKMYWLRLVPGENQIDLSGDGDFVITYQNLLKIGGLVNV